MQLGALLRESIRLENPNGASTKSPRNEKIEDATVADILLESQHPYEDEIGPTASLFKPISHIMGLDDQGEEERRIEPVAEEARRHAVIGRRHLQDASKQTALAMKQERGTESSWDSKGLPTYEERLASLDVATMSLSLVFIDTIAPSATETMKEAAQACTGLRKAIESGLGRLTPAESERLRWATVAICLGMTRIVKCYPGRLEASVIEHSLVEAHMLADAVLVETDGVPSEFNEGNEVLEQLLFEIWVEVRSNLPGDANTDALKAEEERLAAEQKAEEERLAAEQKAEVTRKPLQRSSSASSLRRSRSSGSSSGSLRTEHTFQKLRSMERLNEAGKLDLAKLSVDGIGKSPSGIRAQSLNSPLQEALTRPTSREVRHRSAVREGLFNPPRKTPSSPTSPTSQFDFDANASLGRRRVQQKRAKKENPFEDFRGDEAASSATVERLGNAPKLLVNDSELLSIYKANLRSRTQVMSDHKEHQDQETLYENAKMYHQNTRWVMKQHVTEEEKRRLKVDRADELRDLQMAVQMECKPGGEQENTKRRGAISEVGETHFGIASSASAVPPLMELQKKMGVFKETKEGKGNNQPRAAKITERASFTSVFRGAFHTSKKAQSAEQEEETEMAGKSIYEQEAEQKFNLKYPSPPGGIF